MKTTNYFQAIILTLASVMFIYIPGNTKGSMYNNPTAVIYHPDSIFVYNFEGNSKEIYSYDIQQNLVSFLIQLEVDKGWVDSELTNYTYDENGNLLTATYLQWNGTEWLSVSLNSFTYDVNGNMLTNLGQVWNGTAWVNSMLATYNYDENGNQLSYMIQYWDEEWYNVEMDTYTYDENGNMLTDTWSMWEGTDWMAYMLTTFTYDENGNKFSILEQYYDGEWMNSMFITYTYDDNNNILNHIAQQWMGDYWENMSRAEYTYDSNGNCLSRLDQWWWWSGEWQNTDKSEYEYQQGLIIGHGYTWNDTVWEIGDVYQVQVCLYNEGHQDVLWEYGYCHLIEAYYSGFGVEISEKYEEMPAAFTVFPNPAKGCFTIKTEIIQSEEISIILYDLSGRVNHMLYEGIMQPDQMITVNTDGLCTGFYILEMRTAMNASRQKISIIR